MAFLVQTLPGLKVVDTWDGGWLEAKLYAAGSDGKCVLTHKARFSLIHTDGGEHDYPKQDWFLDFSQVTGVGVKDSRAIYKMKKVDQVLGFDAGSHELAVRIAFALEALRQACKTATPRKF